MRKKKSLAILIMIAITVTPLSLILIYTHDNPADLTSISSINSGTTTIGSNVTIKGNITYILNLFMGPNDQVVQLSDGSGSLEFFWTKTRLSIGWIVIVRGTVSRTDSLWPISNVESVLLFP